MRYPMIVVELDVGASSGPLYLSTMSYQTAPADSPALTSFEPRLMDDVEYDRSVGCVVWGTPGRGTQNWGVIRCANADGRFDEFVGTSLRDASVVIKRGFSDQAYSTFSLAATLIVDRAEFSDELVMALYVTDISAKLERSLQLNIYPDTVSNQAVRGQPRPITFGRCYQVPLVQPDAFGNGHYDLHDTEHWVGVEEVLDRGATLTEGQGYERSTKPGIYGIERLTALGGRQAATVAGAFKIDSTEISEDFANLTSWTETNGGVAGRDVSIVGNAARILNTAGGANLRITWSASTPTGTDDTLWFYEFSCTSWTSGSAEFRTNGTVTQRTIDAVGRYTGVIRSTGNVVPAFWAITGSNCDLTVDAFRLRKVTLMEGLLDCIKFLATDDATVGGRGPLSVTDLDVTAISALEAAAPYAIGFHCSEPIQIADMLDQVMASFGGWWWIDRLGRLTVGRLEAPTGSSVMSFNQTNVAAGVKIELDGADGLSTRMLGKRNWSVFAEDELVSSLQFVQLNPVDKDADVAVVSGGYGYSASNTGSVRSTPLMFGDRRYFEVTIGTVGSNQHYVGVGSDAATITNSPGASADSIAYRSNGDAHVNGSGSAFGASFIAADIIGVAIDGRAGAGGSRSLGYRAYFRKNGTWQNSGDPDAETGYVASAENAVGIAYAMLGAGAAGNAASINLGQATFVHAAPNDYSAPAAQRVLLTKEFRDAYQSSVTLGASYVFADASEAPPVTFTADAEPAYFGGMATMLNRRAQLATESDRVCGLYTQDRFFRTFDGFLAAEDADELEPGDLVDLTYPRFGMSAGTDLRVVGVKGSLLSQRSTVRTWG